MKDQTIEVGRVVRSRAGRDAGRFFVVVQLCDDGQHAMIVDGNLRQLENPKKKKLKHLDPKPDVAVEIKDKLLVCKVSDSDIRKLLSGMGYGFKKEG